MTEQEIVEQQDFEPMILAFCCNWCSYAGADLAGVSRFQYPPSIRVIRVMCSGRVHPTFVLEAFKNGIDGVLVTGCHIGDCHYITGNEYTRERMAHVKNLLKKIGVEEDRFRLEWISASEGKQFAQLVKEFTETIKKLGPSKIKKKIDWIKWEYCE
ncbi:MAG: hydrogenase iron-sulfur subunit [Promethearchaeota archaeon]